MQEDHIKQKHLIKIEQHANVIIGVVQKSNIAMKG